MSVRALFAATVLTTVPLTVAAQEGAELGVLDCLVQGGAGFFVG